ISQQKNTLTSAYLARFHRVCEHIFWEHPIHERLCGGQSGHTARLPGVAFRHFGYDDCDAPIHHQRILRNERIAQAAFKKNRALHFTELLTIARTKQIRGQLDAVDWFHCFIHPEAQPCGNSDDRRVEPANILCAMGVTAPARIILQRNALILSLQISLLAQDTKIPSRNLRAQFIHELLSFGLWDNGYAFDHTLLTLRSPKEILDYAIDLAASWKREIPLLLNRSVSMQPTTILKKAQNIESEILDDELILMNISNRRVTALNATAQVLWQALDLFQTPEELLTLLEEALPDQSRETLEASIEEMLNSLVEQEFLII
ncbi:PqqD family peptide modification chaperone, partial [Magnetococcales bacterium HHB-1]